jgi:hypothetical protein
VFSFDSSLFGQWVLCLGQVQWMASVDVVASEDVLDAAMPVEA